jgi:hypothetical protein
MSIKKEAVLVSSLAEKEIDVKAFIADAKRLAAEKGLAEDEIQFEEEKTFPVEGAILILLGFASKVAYDVWKEFILPRLKEKYRIKQQEASG